MAAEGGVRPEDKEEEEREERDLDAEAHARRRVALAQIRQYPDAVLRMRAREVDSFGDDLARLADRMTHLMHDARGVGLAATQVGILQRFFVFQKEGDEEATAVVNPEIVERSTETEVLDEGCLSLQGVLVPVERSLGVTLTGQDATGAPLRLELGEMDARVVQHELDHLDGVLMIERTSEESRREALATLRRSITG
ncbi:MAG: peptide deformylase [Gaiellaceae bacterium]|jgi:peptide deformylase|nr:peptide deformylase [Gaiellaceae bacterium]